MQERNWKEIKFQIAEGVVAQEIDDAVIVYVGEKNEILSFNKTATLILKILKNEGNYKKIVEKLCTRYEGCCSRDVIEHDVDKILTLLYDKGILNIFN